MLTQDKLKELMEYDPDTGHFTRRTGRRAGHIVGWDNGDGYIRIDLLARKYRAHRLAWLYVHGRWPTADTDHINGDRADNRLCNLREATRTQNLANRKAQNGRALKGITYQRGLWSAQIRIYKKNVYIGRFATAEEANAAYMREAVKVHGEFARAK